MEGWQMASTIRISNTADIRSKAGELETLNEAFRSEVTNLREDESTLRTSFEGESSNAFHTQFTGDMDKFDAFYRAIQQFIQQLRTAADKYDKAEADGVAIASTRGNS